MSLDDRLRSYHHRFATAVPVELDGALSEVRRRGKKRRLRRRLVIGAVSSTLALVLLVSAPAFVGPTPDDSDLVAPGPDTTQHSSTGPSSELSPLPPAPAEYHDRYYGFSFDVPAGWVHHSILTINSFAPDERAMRSYHYNDGGRFRNTFTLTVSARTDSMEEVEAQLRSDRQNGTVTSREDITIGGRPGRRIRLVFDPVLSGCRSCRAVWNLVEWRGVTVTISYVSGDDGLLARHEPAMDALVGSFRDRARDRYHRQMRAFLDARVAGRGADRWVSPSAETFFDRCGLYRIGEGCETKNMDVTSFVVASVTSGSALSTYTVLIEGQEGAQAERLVIGDRGGGAVILKATLEQAAGTS